MSIAALLVAHGCNVGMTPVVGGARALTRDRLSHVDQTYLRLATYKAANATLIAAQAGIPLAQAWGGGLVASVDGMRFVVPSATVYARPNPKYFGRGRGATWLNMLNDQASGLGGMVVAGTPRDSLYVLDVLYDRDGGKRPEMIVTDTASYSDIVYGLLTLAGFSYAPQLADLPDQKLWRINPRADYGPLQQIARGRIALDKIERNWEDICRVIASIHAGAVRAHDVIRMLSRDGRPTPLGDAIAHYGRIPKTLHQIENDVLDESKPLAATLRKCITLGGQAGSADLRTWAARELRGYGPDDELPQYRVVGAPILVDGVTIRHRITAERISAGDLPDIVAEHVGEDVRLSSSIGGIEALIHEAESGDDHSLKLSLPGGAEIVILPTLPVSWEFTTMVKCRRCGASVTSSRGRRCGPVARSASRPPTAACTSPCSRSAGGQPANR